LRAEPLDVDQQVEARRILRLGMEKPAEEIAPLLLNALDLGRGLLY